MMSQIGMRDLFRWARQTNTEFRVIAGEFNHPEIEFIRKIFGSVQSSTIKKSYVIPGEFVDNGYSPANVGIDFDTYMVMLMGKFDGHYQTIAEARALIERPQNITQAVAYEDSPDESYSSPSKQNLKKKY